MAIKTFKEIIDNKGYRISSKDREIFEKGTLQSFFGFSDSDMIEFIVYDANENQLPQGDSGKLVRYIPLNSENIKDYFLIADGTEFQAFNFPNEYFIDAERLINEAGYNNGIFKAQITLLNKRVGFDSLNEKLWIKEISPSRTEVKLLPIRNEVSEKTDLLTRFNIMVEGQSFRDDIIPYIGEFIEKIDSKEIDSFIKRIYTEKWYNKMVSEFGIREFDKLTTRIHKKFAEAMKYEYLNRNSYITDVNYGKQKPIAESLSLSKEAVYKTAQRILVECVDTFLPQRTIQPRTIKENEFDASRDAIGQVIRTRESDVIIQPNVPAVEVTKEKPKESKEKVLEKTNLAKAIKDEVPNDLPIPKFKTPNPTKSKKKSLFMNKFKGFPKRLPLDNNIGGISNPSPISKPVTNPNRGGGGLISGIS
jgi:hypothetical protein